MTFIAGIRGTSSQVSFSKTALNSSAMACCRGECFTTLEKEVGTPSSCKALKDKIHLGFVIPDLECVHMGW